jgi:hypothetical protein
MFSNFPENPKVQGDFCKMPLSSSLRQGVAAWSRPGRRRAPPPSCPQADEEPPGASHLRHESPPSFLPLPRALSPSLLLFPTHTRDHCHGRHLPPPFCASPSFPGVPCRSASPPSSSPSKESTRDGQNHRRRRRFPCRHRAPPLSIALSSNLPCRLQPARKAQGEPLVRPDHLLLSLSLWLAVPARRRRAGRRQTWQGQVLTGRLTRPAWPARLATGSSRQ